jgi:asparagine synthase (glutamine-hydrolysing)
MCGICGFTGRRDPALLRAMAASIRHRGPDDDGFFETDGASLGFRRLAIIDLDTGAQPMSTDGGLLHLVFNGEVYNYRELRAELEAEGRRFTTRSDSEVALQAYAQWGPAAFARFNGMWAIALLDRRGAQPELVLCRDHFGIKPLFYAAHDERGSHLPPPGRRAAALRVPPVRPLRPQRPHLLLRHPSGRGRRLRHRRAHRCHPRDPVLDAGHQ